MSILTRHALHLPRTLARLVGDGYTYEELFPRYLHVLKPPDMSQGSLGGGHAEIGELKRRFGR